MLRGTLWYMGIKSVRFPDELEAQIKVEAERTDRSFNWVVVRAVRDALEPEPGPFVPVPPEARALVDKRPPLVSGCLECGKSNGVHKGSCSLHPRNAR